ncbi:ComF family protein [Priestia megaterium]|uniref:ComF family protein n=1 Tax=Priestia megaterium TaxID=1404 RepID=UPI0026D12103|nr:ComF family protein [Priestia megaterium]
MTICLICFEPLVSSFDWRSLLKPSSTDRICTVCLQRCPIITSSICRGCGRSLADLAPSHYELDTCKDCQKWNDGSFFNRSLYTYSDFMQSIIERFKFQGDYEIIQAFKEQWYKFYKKECNPKAILVPIPLTDERLYERGFNQSLALAELISANIEMPLVRCSGTKQSKKNRRSRLAERLEFKVVNTSMVTNQEFLLIDDIYTTGATVRQAAKCLQEAGARSVRSLTLIRA